MAISITSALDCCGCTACSSICHYGAIEMKSDNKGFAYPKVDSDKCVECGLCEKTCQFKKGYNRYNNYEQPLYYEMRCMDLGQLAQSQSGGAFYLLSQEILEHGGVVYGAIFDEAFRIAHLRAENELERDRMRGSKYVQSDLYGIFSQVKIDTHDGKQVLFSGTPCQVAGLRAFFGHRQPENLITIDLLCHGVTSPLFWRDYLAMIEKRQGRNITKIKMRDKSFGWLSSNETYVFGDKQVHKNTFYGLYYSGYLTRESCFCCPFTNTSRVGDISIGDYQKWNLHHNYFSDNTGVSIVLVNSDKGKALVDKIAAYSNVYLKPSDVIPTEHTALTRTAKRPEEYNNFWKDFSRKGVLYNCKKYGDMGLRTQLHIKIYKLLQRLK